MVDVRCAPLETLKGCDMSQNDMQAYTSISELETSVKSQVNDVRSESLETSSDLHISKQNIPNPESADASSTPEHLPMASTSPHEWTKSNSGRASLDQSTLDSFVASQQPLNEPLSQEEEVPGFVVGPQVGHVHPHTFYYTI
jgi:hypothetical protein